MRNFTKNDTGFVCAHCGHMTGELGYTSRDHCPKCLWSLHVDEVPGDRACGCRGLMRPVRALPERGGFSIEYECVRCGHHRRNRASLREEWNRNNARRAAIPPEFDDMELLIQLTTNR